MCYSLEIRELQLSSDLLRTDMACDFECTLGTRGALDAYSHFCLNHGDIVKMLTSPLKHFRLGCLRKLRLNLGEQAFDDTASQSFWNCLSSLTCLTDLTITDSRGLGLPAGLSKWLNTLTSAPSHPFPMLKTMRCESALVTVFDDEDWQKELSDIISSLQHLHYGADDGSLEAPMITLCQKWYQPRSQGYASDADDLKATEVRFQNARVYVEFGMWLGSELFVAYC